MTTALYRFYDAAGGLLYVGITLNPKARFTDHRHEKPWWHEVSTIKLETHPTREAALAAERLAIIAEHPMHNVVHNRENNGAAYEPVTHTLSNMWSYRTRRGDVERVGPFWWVYELNYESCLCEVDTKTLDGEMQVSYWAAHLRRRGISLDAVPISWFIDAPHGLETPPRFADWQGFGIDHWEDDLGHPRHATTGERLNWLDLDVRHDRFPEFDDALGWRPAPLTTHCPLNAILKSKGFD